MTEFTSLHQHNKQRRIREKSLTIINHKIIFEIDIPPQGEQSLTRDQLRNKVNFKKVMFG